MPIQVGGGTTGGGGGSAVETAFTPAGNVEAVNVQAALEEVDSEKYGQGANPVFNTVVGQPSTDVAGLVARRSGAGHTGDLIQFQDHSNNRLGGIDKDGRLAGTSVAFSATDKLLGRSTAGAGAGEEIACTAAGRALLDDADAAAQRATLGFSTGTAGNDGETLEWATRALANKTPAQRRATLGLTGIYDAGTDLTVNWANGPKQTLSGFISGTLTLSNPVAGAFYSLLITAGANTITWPAAVKWAGGSAPTLGAGSVGVDIVSMMYDGANYLASAAAF